MSFQIVIDTNILVSALLAKDKESPPADLMLYFFSGDVIPIYSEQILAEYKDVLYRKNFSFPKEQVDYLIKANEKFGMLTVPQKTETVLPDINDTPFYEAYFENKSDKTYLVTGNIKHFPPDDFIITARKMIEIIVDSYQTKKL